MVDDEWFATRLNPAFRFVASFDTAILHRNPYNFLVFSIFYTCIGRNFETKQRLAISVEGALEISRNTVRKAFRRGASEVFASERVRTRREFEIEPLGRAEKRTRQAVYSYSVSDL